MKENRLRMKPFGTTACLLLLFIIGIASADTLTLQTPAQSGLFYTNPPEDIRLPGMDVADPAVFVDEDGTYYCYPSSGTIEGFIVWSSADLVHWTKHGYCFQRTDDHWASGDYWAPGMTKHNGKYYLSYSAKDKSSGCFRIAIAVSDSPPGPFADIRAPGPLGGFSVLPHNTPSTPNCFLTTTAALICSTPTTGS